MELALLYVKLVPIQMLELVYVKLVLLKNIVLGVGLTLVYVELVHIQMLELVHVLSVLKILIVLEMELARALVGLVSILTKALMKFQTVTTVLPIITALVMELVVLYAELAHILMQGQVHALFVLKILIALEDFLGSLHVVLVSILPKALMISQTVTLVNLITTALEMVREKLHVKAGKHQIQAQVLQLTVHYL
jgi:hypothetical protein